MDATIQTLKIDKVDDGLSTGRKQVVRFLRNYKETESGVELRRRNVVFHEDSEEVQVESSVESTPSTLQRFNDKLKKKEMERLQRMNKTVCEESSQEDMDELHSPTEINKGAIMSEDDDSQENQCEAILSYPSSSSTELQTTSSSQINNQLERSQIVSSVDDMVPCDAAIPTFSDDSDYEGNDVGDEDSTYASMDEVEMVDLDDQSSVVASTAFIDPVSGLRSSSHSSTGQVPSLVSQKSANWLVDDVGSRTAKRKRPAKQTKLTGSIEQTKRTSTTARPKHRSSLSTSQKVPRPKQSRLAVSKECRTPQNAIRVPGSSVSNVSTPVPSRPSTISTVPGANARISTGPSNIVAPAGPPPMRLRVRVQDKLFMIPCPHGNTQEAKNIGWLAEQVSIVWLQKISMLSPPTESVLV